MQPHKTCPAGHEMAPRDVSSGSPTEAPALEELAGRARCTAYQRDLLRFKHEARGGPGAKLGVTERGAIPRGESISVSLSREASYNTSPRRHLSSGSPIQSGSSRPPARSYRTLPNARSASSPAGRALCPPTKSSRASRASTPARSPPTRSSLA